MEAINTLLEKISSYNLLTNIIPGAVLCAVLRYLVGYDLIVENNWLIIAVTFYIVGVINNRFGSVVIEPFLKWVRFIKRCSYEEFIEVEKTDHKLTTLSTENNVFRSYLAVFFLSMLAVLYRDVLSKWCFLADNIDIILIVLSVALFAFAYRKQTRIITQRVKIESKE